MTTTPKTAAEWMRHYEHLPLKDLKIHAGQSMGLSTAGGREAILDRIRALQIEVYGLPTLPIKDKIWDDTLSEFESSYEAVGHAAFWMSFTGSTYDHSGYYELRTQLEDLIDEGEPEDENCQDFEASRWNVYQDCAF
jgi:hypothetical protein